jgi:hypothetical protein
MDERGWIATELNCLQWQWRRLLLGVSVAGHRSPTTRVGDRCLRMRVWVDEGRHWPLAL